MKKVFYSLWLIVSILSFSSCRSEGSQPNSQDEPVSKLKKIPTPPVEFGATLAQIEEAEIALSSEEIERNDAAGYIKLEYKSKDALCPFRVYLVKKDLSRMTIAGLYSSESQAVWMESNTLYPYFVALFEADGYKYDIRIDNDNKKHHYFVKSIHSEAGEYLECLVQKEVYKDQEYTTYSYRITDTIIGQL